MSKQSSIEWLIDQIDFDANERCFSQPEWFAIYEKAKAMHRKEIEEAYVYGAAYQIDIKNGLSPIFYYKERFGDEEVL